MKDATRTVNVHYAIMQCKTYGCGAILQDCRGREIKFKIDFCGKAWCPHCGAEMKLTTCVETIDGKEGS